MWRGRQRVREDDRGRWDARHLVRDLRGHPRLRRDRSSTRGASSSRPWRPARAPRRLVRSKARRASERGDPPRRDGAPRGGLRRRVRGSSRRSPGAPRAGRPRGARAARRSGGGPPRRRDRSARAARRGATETRPRDAASPPYGPRARDVERDRGLRARDVRRARRAPPVAQRDGSALPRSDADDRGRRGVPRPARARRRRVGEARSLDDRRRAARRHARACLGRALTSTTRAGPPAARDPERRRACAVGVRAPSRPGVMRSFAPGGVGSSPSRSAPPLDQGPSIRAGAAPRRAARPPRATASSRRSSPRGDPATRAHRARRARAPAPGGCCASAARGRRSSTRR